MARLSKRKFNQTCLYLKTLRDIYIRAIICSKKALQQGHSNYNHSLNQCEQTYIHCRYDTFLTKSPTYNMNVLDRDGLFLKSYEKKAQLQPESGIENPQAYFVVGKDHLPDMVLRFISLGFQPILS